MSKSLLIVSHAPSDNTRTLLDAVRGGALDATDDGAVAVTSLSPFEAGPDAVLSTDAIILGTTENLGYMSGALKDFFDRTYYGVIEEKQGLPFALYIRAGLDGTGTRRAVESIATGLRWKPMRDPLICRGDWQDAFVDECRELGMLAAAGLDAGIY